MRAIAYMILACFLVSGCSSTPEAESAEAPRPTRFEIRPQDIAEETESWFGIYSDGKKVGWSYNNQRVVNDKAVIEQVQMMRVPGGERQVFEQLIFEDAYPYKLHSARSAFKEGSIDRKTELRMMFDRSMRVVTRSAGQSTTDIIVAPEYTLADAFTPGLWLERERTVGDRLVSREFSPTDLNSSIVTHEVVETRSMFIDGVHLDVLVVEFASDTGAQSVVTVDREGQVLELTTAGVLEFRREDEEQARNIDHSVDLFASRRVQVVPALEGADGMKTATLESIVFKNGRVQLPLPTEPVTDRVSYLGETPTAAAIAHASRMREDPGTLEWAQELAIHVARMVDDEYRAGTTTTDALFKELAGDCTEHARLFVLVAAAAGVPAREVSGLLYAESERSFLSHVWCEVAIEDEWIPIDPTLGKLVEGATHVPDRVLAEKWPSTRSIRVLESEPRRN